MNTLPDDPLRAGEQYFLDLAGNIKKGPIAKAQNCHCGPAFEKFEKKLERDKRELLRHIDSSHTKLDTKISSLEKKTRDQLFNLNQSMKESFALERSECLDRMDRRALRERIAIERQQAVRDVGLKRDLATWLDKKLQEIEAKHGGDAKNAALLRSLAVRASKRGKTKYVLGDMEGGGGLRRALSEELLSDVGAGEEVQLQGAGPGPDCADCHGVYKGLTVSDKPSNSSRARRNSAGDTAASPRDLSPAASRDVTRDLEAVSRVPSVTQHSTASESGTLHDTSVSSAASGSALHRSGLIRPIPQLGHGYPSDHQPPPELQHPGPGMRRFTTEADIHHAAPLLLDPAPAPPPVPHQQAPPPHQQAPPLYRGPPQPGLYRGVGRLARPGPLLPPVTEVELGEAEHYSGPAPGPAQDLHRQLLGTILTSDSQSGSHDSHNDSGYSTRLGASAGPSPSLSGEQRLPTHLHNTMGASVPSTSVKAGTLSLHTTHLFVQGAGRGGVRPVQILGCFCDTSQHQQRRAAQS